MNSKSKAFSIIALILCLGLIGLGILKTNDEKTKVLEHIILQTNSNKLIWEYSNDSQNITTNPFNLSFPVISESGKIINEKNIYNIKENFEIQKVNTLEGLIYSYKDNGNYMVNSSERYLIVVTDNIENTYYQFDAQFNFLNCRQIIQYMDKVLCLSTYLGNIFELHKSDTASRFAQFDKPGYVISGLYNLGGNTLVVYQSYNTNLIEGEIDPPKQILRINEKDIPLQNNFVYQVAFKAGNYLISTISESNISNKINSYEIFQLSPTGELVSISQNSVGIFLY